MEIVRSCSPYWGGLPKVLFTVAIKLSPKQPPVPSGEKFQEIGIAPTHTDANPYVGLAKTAFIKSFVMFQSPKYEPLVR
jgi:hypothetical protein